MTQAKKLEITDAIPYGILKFLNENFLKKNLEFSPYSINYFLERLRGNFIKDISGKDIKKIINEIDEEEKTIGVMAVSKLLYGKISLPEFMTWSVLSILTELITEKYPINRTFLIDAIAQNSFLLKEWEEESQKMMKDFVNSFLEN